MLRQCYELGLACTPIPEDHFPVEKNGIHLAIHVVYNFHIMGAPLPYHHSCRMAKNGLYPAPD